MRKFFLALLICTLFVSGFFIFVAHRIYRSQDNNISINVRETDNTLQVYASYSRYKTKRVQNYIDRQLNTHVFRNARIDADMTLEDNLFVHVKNRPGLMVIRMDKSKNSEEAYHRLKDLAEGIKRELGEDNN